MVKKVKKVPVKLSEKYSRVRAPKQLDVRFKGKKVVSDRYQVKDSLANIQEFADAKSKALKEDGFDGRMSVAIHYPNKGWRAGRLQEIGDKVHFFSPDGYDDESDMIDFEDDAGTTKEFYFYYVMNPTRKGGHTPDDNKDCLYNCLKAAMHEDVPWTYAASMKKWLGLERNEAIDIAFMQKIEARCKTYKINVTGDHTYTSTKNNNLEIRISLINGHYSLIPNKTVPTNGISFKERIPLIYSNINDNSEVSVCDGVQEWTITKQEYREIYCKPKSSAYLLVPQNSKFKDKFEQHAAYIIKADTLKEGTSGLVNMYKTGKDPHAALALFAYTQKAVYPDHIDQIEGEWINATSLGALSYADKGYTGPGYKYDFISAYASIMADAHTLFPFKKGTYHIITTEELNNMTIIPYGMYKCHVEVAVRAFKEFRYNSENRYTHIDLMIAKKLNLELTMCSNGEANQCLYTRSTSLVTGRQLFGKFVNKLFPLKKQGVKEVKPLLVCLWGALSESKTQTYEAKVNTDDVFHDLENDTSIQTIVPINHDTVRVMYCKNNDMFSTDYARIKPFMLAYGRLKIQSAIAGINSIVHVHTDGFISSEKLDITTGTELGDLKYEGYCPEIKVVNVNKVIGTFE